MHQVVASIQALWEIDHALETTKDTIKTLYQRVQEKKAELEAARAHVTSCEQALEAAKESERALNRKLNNYTNQRDRTKAMIDDGSAPDYDAATRQYEQCAAIADQTENELLEAIDTSESCRGALQDANTKVEQAEDNLRRVSKAYQEKDPGLRKELDRLTPIRHQRWEVVHPSDQTAYKNLRRLKREPFAQIHDGTCGACHNSVPKQMVIEVANDKQPHACRGCQRWLQFVEPGEE